MVSAKKPGKKVVKSGQETAPTPTTEAVAEAAVVAAAVAEVIPDGRPKSGRVWKTKQQARFSTIKRSGMMNFLCKTREEKEVKRIAHQNMKELEKELKDEKKAKLAEEKRKREERNQRRLANEYKNSVYQVIKPETMKGMSKKQLRMVRKTAVNKSGQVELVNPFGGSSGGSGKLGGKMKK